MSNLERIKIHRIVRDKGNINALYSGVIKRSGYYSTTYERDYIGSFSKSEWSKIRLRRVNYFFVKNLFWLAWLIGVGLVVSAFTIFANSTFFGVVSMLLGIIGVIFGIGDLMGRDVDNEFIGENILKKLKLTPTPPAAEVLVRDFLRIDEKTLVKYLKSLPKKDFVEVTEQFAKWNKARSAYIQLDEQIGYKHNYEDDELLDFVNSKKKALYAKVRDNEVEANALSKEIRKNAHHATLIKALQETEEILAS